VFATANPCPAAGGIAFKQGPLPLLQPLGFQAQCVGCSAVNNTCPGKTAGGGGGSSSVTVPWR